MKLISSTHDYYDGIAHSTRTDPKIIFIRKPELFPVKHEFTGCRYQSLVWNDKHHYQINLIGFCGRLIPYIYINVETHNSMGDGWETHEYYFYDYDELIKNVPFFSINPALKNKWKYNYNGRVNIRNWLKEGVWKFNDYSLNSKRNPSLTTDDEFFKSLFLNKKIAYFNLDFHDLKTLHVNTYPILRDIGFPSFMDAQTAFQELDRYLSNELVRPDEIKIVIPDKLKAESHGFDKFSFRKDKTSG